jgi:hypothetical protein
VVGTTSRWNRLIIFSKLSVNKTWTRKTKLTVKIKRLLTSGEVLQARALSCQKNLRQAFWLTNKLAK